MISLISVYSEKRMRDANFPYDVQWTDIDVMANHLDFTYDNKSFHGLPDLVHEIQSGGQHYVNIIDPGISSTQQAGSYPAYDEGIKQGIFIKKADSNDPIIGKVIQISRLSVNFE
jgi:alpha-glucosidase (family GH31 glycosyl hydrolase)